MQKKTEALALLITLGGRQLGDQRADREVDPQEPSEDPAPQEEEPEEPPADEEQLLSDDGSGTHIQEEGHGELSGLQQPLRIPCLFQVTYLRLRRPRHPE